MSSLGLKRRGSLFHLGRLLAFPLSLRKHSRPPAVLMAPLTGIGSPLVWLGVGVLGNIRMGFFIDVDTLPAGVGGDFQLLFLFVAYGYLLYIGSDLISSGSELLLLVPSLADLVGSVVLPVLGAVPDGAIVLFSGLGDDAQAQLDVGIGALAGSTILLLTLPWGVAVIAGRVNLNPDGTPNYRGRPRLNPDAKFTEGGVGVSGDSVRQAVRCDASCMRAMRVLMFCLTLLTVTETRRLIFSCYHMTWHRAYGWP